MGKYFFITYSENIENAQLMKDRIKQYEDYFNYYSNIRLQLSMEGSEVYEIDLAKQKDRQVLYAGDGMEYGVDLTTGEEIDYKVVYYREDDPITASSGTVTFIDN